MLHFFRIIVEIGSKSSVSQPRRQTLCTKRGILSTHPTKSPTARSVPHPPRSSDSHLRKGERGPCVKKLAPSPLKTCQSFSFHNTEDSPLFQGIFPPKGVKKWLYGAENAPKRPSAPSTLSKLEKTRPLFRLLGASGGESGSSPPLPPPFGKVQGAFSKMKGALLKMQGAK